MAGAFALKVSTGDREGGQLTANHPKLLFATEPFSGF